LRGLSHPLHQFSHQKVFEEEGLVHKFEQESEINIIVKKDKGK